MTASVDLHAIINEVFTLSPPDQYDFDDSDLGNERYRGAFQQFEELHPLIMKMAKALEEVLTMVEAQSALLREAEAINDRYDEVLQSLLKEEA